MTPPAVKVGKSTKPDSEAEAMTETEAAETKPSSSKSSRTITPGKTESTKSETPTSSRSYTVKDEKSKSRMSTASRKTQTSQDAIERAVGKIKAQLKTGEDIDAQEVLKAVLLMLDDMRLTLGHLKDEKSQNTAEVEIVEQSGPVNEVGEKHSLMNINVKSIQKNLAALQMYNQLQCSPSFIVVTETATQDLDQAQLAGYHDPVFKTRNATKLKGGGVGIYVKTQYAMELCEKLTSIEYKVKHVEFIGVEVSLEDFWKILLVGIFRPSGKTPADILKELELIFKAAIDTKLPFIAAGDLNIDISNVNDALAKKYIALINKYNLKMIVRDPTRIGVKSNAIFDHILVSEGMTSEVTASVSELKIADHQISIAEWF